MSQESYYMFPPKHFNSQKAYFNNCNKNTAIAYMNDKSNSSNYQQCGQTPVLLVMEHFRHSFSKPYAASSAKQSERCFHWAWKYFIKKYDVLSPSFQLHHTVNKILFFFSSLDKIPQLSVFPQRAVKYYNKSNTCLEIS